LPFCRHEIDIFVCFNASVLPGVAGRTGPMHGAANDTRRRTTGSIELFGEAL